MIKIKSKIKMLTRSYIQKKFPHYLEPLKQIAEGPKNNVFEIQPIIPVKSQIDQKRINLIIPIMDIRYIFGGISTVIQFFNQISSDYKYSRIILTGTIVPPLEYRGDFKEFTVVNGDSGERNQIISMIESNKVLPVGSNDIFISTTWYSAYKAQRILEWQKENYSNSTRPLIYFIQDYEPGFYPWSSQYLLSRSTYDYNGPMISIFNTSLLKEYTKMQGHSFEHEFSFEPQMNPTLFKELKIDEDLKGLKKKRLLIYGRPSIHRNAFSLIIETLKIWAETYPDADQWEIYSIGESHYDVTIGKGIVVKSAGKLSLKEYASFLQESAVSLSLMVSPHPSYPPLEMAHFGILVLTNKFENKDISTWHDNIFSSSDNTPETLSKELIKLCNEFNQNKSVGERAITHIPHYVDHKPLFPFANKVNNLIDEYTR